MLQPDAIGWMEEFISNCCVLCWQKKTKTTAAAAARAASGGGAGGGGGSGRGQIYRTTHLNTALNYFC